MNPAESFDPPAALFVVRRSRRERVGGFALVVTLLIVSLLAIVAVSFLTSMSSERQTADAYTSKTRAEQAAQAGVEAAEAILAQSFRDFPDSATVWDTKQTLNSGTPNSSSTVNSPYNEGTSLYLHAMPTGNGVADPQYTGQATAANSLTGNNPNNLACKTFKLPLISGVLGGNAQLASTTPLSTDLTEMDPSRQTDPTKTYCTDLNVRRSQGDLQGAIGSPPTWTTSGTTPVGPKPARANWVNLKGSDGRVTGRYAFWVEDESFRVNVNSVGDASTRVDNGPDASGKYPADPVTKQPHIATPIDASLSGALLTFSSNSNDDAKRVIDTRSFFTAGFFPEPTAFSHTFDADPKPLSTATSTLIEGLRYLTTTQSGTLNLTRHGTQRLNLNTTVVTVDPVATNQIQKQVDQLVRTLQFHLPYFGQRFYRNNSATDPGTLNNTTMVNQTSTMKSEGVGDPALIYLYKVAANIRDYIDNDSQPTVIQAGGTVAPAVAPNQPFGDDSQPNPMWAIGKESAPFLQETAIRFRPIAPQSDATGGKGNYKLAVDYYLEFWNMTDHDVYAAPQSDPTKASLNGAKIRITNQQTWVGYPSGGPFAQNSSPPPISAQNDFTIDLSLGTNAAGNPVVFRAGSATVITTDPDYKTYNFTTPNSSSIVYRSLTGIPNPQTTFYCPIIAPGTRTYTGRLATGDYGLQPQFRDGTQDYQTEVTFFNNYGYFDCALFGIAEGGSPVKTFTDSSNADGGYNNYSYGGSLYGNTLVSEMGDPRTNNEQLMFHRASGAATGDLSRYYNGNHTLGYPDANYVQPVGGSLSAPGASGPSTFIPWPDYYGWQDTSGYTNPTPATAPAVIADKPLTSIGQLGDVYDPARINASVIEAARGGGRTFKIGQRDDRITYDPAGSPSATLDNVPASQSWAAWRLADVFSAGPVDLTNPTGPIQEPIELPARLNINGVARDNGATLRTLLTGFNFQPSTADPNITTSEPLFHTPPVLAGTALSLQPTDNVGLSKLITQITTRLQTPPSNANVPRGPFFERGELGELEVNSTALFGKNVASTSTSKSTDLTGVDLNHTFDRGREELFRRIAEMICTRGDTFTVYVVGQSILQQNPQSALQIKGTQRMHVTFRLLPKIKDLLTGLYHPFHPAYNTKSDNDPTIVSATDYDPSKSGATAARFVKPDHYDVQILEVNSF